MVWTTNVVRELPYRPGVDEAEPVCLSEREVALLASRGVLDDKRIRHLHRKGAIAGLDRAYTQVGVLQPGNDMDTLNLFGFSAVCWAWVPRR
jgi:hypothetical protein